MIRPGEIQRNARKIGVRDQQIEKDYIISWILYGVSQHKKLPKILAFKGGTVLKKIYFKDYRFSEDIDFTLLRNEITNEQIFEWYDEVFEFVKEEANILLEIIDNKEHEDGGINFYISYIGPLGGQGANKSVKIDISRSEQLEFEPIYLNAILSYSDQEAHKILCYRLEELLTEKLRSVIQRMQPRDFYDIWYLLEVYEMEVDFYITEFKSKCESKGINPATFHDKLEQRIPQYRGRWKKSMNEQIQNLPDFSQIVRETKRHLRTLVV